VPTVKFPNHLSLSENRILSQLPEEEQRRLRPELESVSLTQTQVLYEPGDRLEYAYFPQRGVISLVSMTEDGMALEVGLVGREGMAGLPLVLNAKTSPGQAVVQVPGTALRIKARPLREAFNRDGTFREFLLGYTHLLMQQLTQSALCNRFHEVEQRLCRWLLMSRDCIDSKELPLTQEFLSHMLGVRRPSVTLTAKRLQGAGLIRYTRGQITLLDPEGLEDSACECYGLFKGAYERFLRT
jgi:CRP-like cAMP-binding protein